MIKKPTLTAIVPALIEAKNISRCLKSLDWCDEVIVMCMGKDETANLAKKLGARVVVRNSSSVDDFYKVQENINWAMEHAKSDWILRVDADEVVTPELKTEIQKILPSANVQSAYGIPRSQYFGGDFLKGGDWFYDRLVRLCRKGHCRYEPLSHVHEQFKVKGTVGYLKNRLLHFSHPTYKDAVVKYRKYAVRQAQDLSENKVLAFVKMLVNPVYVFGRWLVWHHGYRDGLRGIVAASLRGWYEYILYRQYLRTNTYAAKKN